MYSTSQPIANALGLQEPSSVSTPFEYVLPLIYCAISLGNLFKSIASS